ncbi:unnamed protein product [Symbiodinium natans]|uniref:DUF4185 domain-containing protein n=1 Tax=Symbiodinium natans TaxID=878477 RepID=A0A812JZM2_9DINO|nr:unnamed protein product [Symbiodinium natans]
MRAFGILAAQGAGALAGEAFTWPNQPPSDIPFERSELFTEVHFTGRYAEYGGADTWYPSWGADGNLYTPWTDGVVGGIRSHSACSGPSCTSTTGFAKVVGDDPFNLSIQDVGVFESSTSPYHGRYPSASLHHNGIWYYGTYALDNENHEPGERSGQEVGRSHTADYCGNWCIQGPFVGFRWSRDAGKTWQEPRKTLANYSDTLFGEAAPNNHSKVKFGAPHVVDLGQNLAHEPYGGAKPRLYMVGHGASAPISPTSWMQGAEVYLARVSPSVDSINDLASWEFYGNGSWHPGDVARAAPLVSWGNRTGVTTMTYIPAVKRYIMCVSTPTFSPFTTRQFDTYFLESANITGPFRYISYLREFGPQAYFVNIPSKFVAASTGSDGSLRLFLSYSANFAYHGQPAPAGSGYHWTLQEVELRLGTAQINI